MARFNSSCPEKTTLVVLLADDIPANQRLLSRILERRGHRVIIAQNGCEAVELFQEHDFDVVLMDLQMPLMDGRQAATLIRRLERPEGPGIPIIAMTAHTLQGDRERCLQAGMNGYIAKPVDIDTLVELVEGMAAGPRTTNLRVGPAGARSTEGDVDPAVLDVEGALRRLAGDRELFQEFVRFYDEDSPGLVESVDQAIGDGRADLLQQAAHSLKGLAGNLGGEAVSSAAQVLEQMGRTCDMSGAAEALSALRRELDRLDARLAPFRA